MISVLDDDIPSSAEGVAEKLRDLGEEFRRTGHRVIATIYDDADEFAPILMIGLGANMSVCLFHSPRSGNWLEGVGVSAASESEIVFTSSSVAVRASAGALVENGRAYQAAAEFCRTWQAPSSIEWAPVDRIELVSNEPAS